MPNLAGLARTCEVFRAQALALPDLKATRDPLFASISVTAGGGPRAGLSQLSWRLHESHAHCMGPGCIAPLTLHHRS